MASRYFVGGTATWDATAGTKWSSTSGGAGGASIPTSSDDVFFDAASGSGTVTISASSVCRSLDCTGFTGTLTHPATTSLLIYGSLTFSTAMTYTLVNATNSRTYFSSSAAGNTITLNGKVMGDCTFNAVGDWSFMSAFTSTGSIAHSYGEINTNNQAVSATSYNSNVSYVRTLTLGNSTVTLTAASALTVNGSNLTITPNTATIICSGTNASVTTTNKDWNGTSFSFTGAGNATLSAAGSTFRQIIRNGTAATTCTMLLAGDVTATDGIDFSGAGGANRLLVASSVIGSQRLITNDGAAMTLADVDFRDVAFSTAYDASSSLIGDCDGNSNITFRSPATLYWKTATTGIKLWSAAANWFYGSNGTGGQAHIPLPQDDCVFDAYSIGATSTTVRIDTGRAGRNVSFADVANSPTLNVYVPTSYYGSLTLASGMTQTFTSTSYTFEGRGNHTITTAGKSFNSTTINCYTGSYVLQDAWTLGNYQLSVLSGDFSANGYNVTCASWASTLTASRSIHMGSGTWTCGSTGVVVNLTSTGLTLYPETSVLRVTNETTTAKTVTAGGIAFGTVEFYGNNINVIGNNSFGHMMIDTATLSIGLKLTSGTTQTVDHLTSDGSSSIGTAKISATTAGSPATLYSTSQQSVDYLDITDIAATGASFYAGTHSVDNGGNSGWVFTDPPSGTVIYGSAALLGTGSLAASGLRTAVGAAGLTSTSLLSAVGHRVAITAADLSGLGNMSAAAVRVLLGSAALTGGTGGTHSTYSVWTDDSLPGTPESSDVVGVELGAKFYVDVDGTVDGIKFYKTQTNDGTYVVNLWTSTGVLMASALVPSSSSAGWHTASFATPVPITAGTTYIASYYCPQGLYAFDSLYFATSGVDSGLLHIPSGPSSGNNGVFKYGSASVFPDESFNNSNYWCSPIVSTGIASSIPAVRIATSSANLSAVSSLVASGTIIKVTSAVLSSTGSLTASGIVISTAGVSAHFTANGTLSASGIVIKSTTVNLAGTGIVSARGCLVNAGSANLTGHSALSASSTRIAVGDAALSANSQLAAFGILVRVAAAQLFGTGSLIATPYIAIPGGHALLIMLLPVIDASPEVLNGIDTSSKQIATINARIRSI